MINKARRADNIIEWIIIGIVAIIFLNLFLGKVYDHFQETVASSKLNKMFQPEQTRFEPSSNANYADASSQINVPLVGEQGLERYKNGAIRVIQNLINKDLSGNWLWQRNLAEEATVLNIINTLIDNNSAYSSLSGQEAYDLQSKLVQYMINIDLSSKRTRIGQYGAVDYFEADYSVCPWDFSTEDMQIKSIACIKYSFSKN
ncbi:MAG TPA: hypothetical protein PLG15_05665 [Candidatus Gastranaerophilaceae bacterium]|nr:hypothetical protein [Candidatus Gastranaerophilaceae bacterium]HPT41852.1 hypothetical protein [Candidatus Gastranaerophilaceae bacterium]